MAEENGRPVVVVVGVGREGEYQAVDFRGSDADGHALGLGAGACEVHDP